MSEKQTYKPDLAVSREELESAFPDGSYLLAVTAVHGLEPPIIACGVGIKINDELEAKGLPRKPIVIPQIYKDRLERVLRDEFPDHQSEIFLSPLLGETLNMTEFDTSGYQNHLEQVANWQELTQVTLRNQILRPLEITSLDGTRRIIEPSQKAIELNIGANVTATREAHSIFPIRFSDLLELIKRDPYLYETYNPDTIRRVEVIARKMEESHKTTQIPDHHSMMTYDWFDPSNIIFVPHLKDPKSPPSSIDTTANPKGGIYVNVSGGGMGVEMASIQAKSLHDKGWAVLAPSWLKLDFAVPAGPNALYLRGEHGKFVKAFIMRPGYGSIWNAIEAEIGIGYLPSDVYESPEMKANENALASTGFGRVFSPRHDIVEQISLSEESIRTYKESMYRRLNLPYGSSGLKVAAQNIIRSEVGKSLSG